jgi:hypothetical protein
MGSHRNRKWPRTAAALAKVLSLLSALALLAQSPRPAGDAVPLQVIIVRSEEEALQIIGRLRNGEDFGVVAKEKSIDPTASDGGFMGKLSRGELRAELRSALSGVGPGQLTPVVRVPSGYAVLKVLTEADAARQTAAEPARNFALAAAGTVKYMLDINGLAEADAVLSRFPKAPGWNRDPGTVCEMRKQSLATYISGLKDLLATGKPASVSAFELMQTHYSLAQLYAYQGEMGPAIEQYLASYQVALSDVPTAVPIAEEALGIAYLHQAEMENGVYLAPDEKCIFPIKRENAFRNKDKSKRAIEYLLKYLDKKPDALDARWLLNVAYMTIGRYPEGVPRAYLIAPSAFESKEDIGRFVDVASEAGFKSISTAGGVIVDDFENNGFLDVVTSGFESCGSMHYFHNNGDGTFTDQTGKAGLSGQPGALNIVQADYNNDGCLDILVLRGAWEFPQRKSLLRNNCDGTFTDVTATSGLAREVTSSQAAVWADVNNDGWLDLFVGNENEPAQLFLNKGDGTFEDISASSGVAGDGTSFSKGVTAADYDNDGYVDFYVSNLNGRNFLYRNNHDNTFTEVSAKAGVPGNGRGFATWFFDYDNDGLPDLFVTSYFTSVDETARTYLGLPHNADTLRLYKNMGDGTFRDVTVETGLDKVYMPMGANFGDVDNDGYLDIYLGTGNPSYGSLVPNVLLRNHDGKYFVDITSSSGTGELHKGHGIAFADLGNSGNEEIVAEVGGATPGDSHGLRVFSKPDNGNDWITLRLVGVKTNRSAIGAKIKVTVQNQGHAVRAIYRTVGSGGSFGASPLQQHIGLGKSARIVSLEVLWPASKTRQVFSGVEKNQFLEVKELEEKYSKLERKSFQLGAPMSAAAAPTRKVQSRKSTQ